MLGNYVLRLILTNPNPFWKTIFLGGGGDGEVVWGRVGVTSSISHFFLHMTKLFSFKKLKKMVIKYLGCGFSMEEETSQGHSSGC